MDVSFFEESPRLTFNKILQNTHTLQTLTEDLITDLQETLGEGKFLIDKFKVRPVEWHDWWYRKAHINPALRDAVEYDTARQYVVVKGKPGPLADAVSATFEEFFEELGDLMFGICRHSLYGKDKEQGDCFSFPFVELEVGVNESSKKLFENAEAHLQHAGGSNKKNVVIVIDIQERRPPPIRSFKQFDLTAEDIKALDVQQIGDAIIKWYQRSRNPLVGDFSLGVYLCYPDFDVETIYKGDILPSNGHNGNGHGGSAPSTPCSRGPSAISSNIKGSKRAAANITYGRLIPALQNKREFTFPVPVEKLLAELQKTVIWVLPHYRAQRKAAELKKRVVRRRATTTSKTFWS